jgi:hypothetical protein
MNELNPDGMCYYCREKTNNLSGNPSMWCVMLPHKDEPGVVKPHHIGCVVERLENGWKKIERTKLSKIVCEFLIEKQSARRAGQNTMYADKLADIIIGRLEDENTRKVCR